MATKYSELTDAQAEFISKQHIYFVGTAPQEGHVNVSPKGMDSFRVLDRKRVMWLNLTGSGNETAAHVLENKRMTIMFCSFDRQPLILRLYGTARAIYERDSEWSELIKEFPSYTGARQIFVCELEMTQDSCGYAVPFYELKKERQTLTKWADGKGMDGMPDYWKEKNTHSIDGLETGIFGDSS